MGDEILPGEPSMTMIVIGLVVGSIFGAATIGVWDWLDVTVITNGFSASLAGFCLGAGVSGSLTAFLVKE